MNKIKFSRVIFVLIFLFLVFHISQQSELGGDTWGYWFFNKIFKREGTFIIPERSPIYVIYLSLFSWLDYPLSFMTERFVSSFFVISTIFFFFLQYLGRNIAFLATFIWAPFIIAAEPPTQALAIGAICWAMIIRNKEEMKRMDYSFSYTLLIISYMLRVTNIIFVMLFLAYDIFKLLKKSGIRGLSLLSKSKSSFFPIVLVLMLGLWMAVSQSNHPWNNAWFSDAKWFPSTGKSLRDAGFIGGYNQSYITQQGKNIGDQDFYFTNKELFKGASTMGEAIKANPRFVFEQLKSNASSWVHAVFSFFLTGDLFFPFTIFAVLTLVAGAICSHSKPRFKSDDLLIFILGTLIVVASSILVLVNMRYLPPLLIVVPLFIPLVKEKLKVAFNTLYHNSKLALIVFLIFIALAGLPLLARVTLIRFGIFILVIVISTLFLMFSYYKMNSSHFFKRISLSPNAKIFLTIILVAIFSAPVKWRNAKIFGGQASFEFHFSPQKSYKEITSLVQNCRGIMSLEATMLGGYLNISHEKIYSIFEIPPFGNLGNSVYGGLEEGRIDCLLISPSLSTYNPTANCNNANIRYKNYIEPFAKALLAKGAKQCKIANYGTAIILAKIDETKFKCAN